MYYIFKALNQELSTARTYGHNLIDERSVFNRRQRHMASKFGAFVDEDHSKLPGYQNFIKYHIRNMLLLILAQVQLLSCLKFDFLS